MPSESLVQHRPIRFRAWDTKQAKWLTEVPYEEYMLSSDEWDAPDYGEMCEALSFFPNSPMGPTFNGRIVYEQFIGLKDKNGVDIYEGDIVDFRTYGRAHGPEAEICANHEVWFDIEGGCWTFGRFTHPHCDEPFDHGYTISGDRIDAATLVVKGNVHEHKHLLKAL